MDIQIESQTFLLNKPFVIARGLRTESDLTFVNIKNKASDIEGCGEGAPITRYNRNSQLDCKVLNDFVSENEQLLNSIEKKQPHLANKKQLKLIFEQVKTLEASSARHAFESALIDYYCKILNIDVFELLSNKYLSCLPETYQRPHLQYLSAQTLSIASQAKTSELIKEIEFCTDPSNLHSNSQYEKAPLLIKVKCNQNETLERLKLVRQSYPKAKIIIDANESWSYQYLLSILEDLIALQIEMIEQPLAQHHDQALSEYKSKYHNNPDAYIKLCADESCHTRQDLDNMTQRYDMINIKLDKTGGIIEAIALAEAARQKGLKVMCGCMVSTSLCLAPLSVIAPYCDYLDCDGPAWLQQDRINRLLYFQQWVRFTDLTWGNINKYYSTYEIQ